MDMDLIYRCDTDSTEMQDYFIFSHLTYKSTYKNHCCSLKAMLNKKEQEQECFCWLEIIRPNKNVYIYNIYYTINKVLSIFIYNTLSYIPNTEGFFIQLFCTS